MIEHLELRSVALSEVLDADLRTSAPAAFVGDTWQKSTRRPLEDLRELLRLHTPTVIAIATPVSRPDLFLGWAAVVPSRNAIVHAYVKASFRAPKEGDSEFRVGSSLLTLLGIDFSRPVPCFTWSKAAARIAAKPGNPYNLENWSRVPEAAGAVREILFDNRRSPLLRPFAEGVARTIKVERS